MRAGATQFCEAAASGAGLWNLRRPDEKLRPTSDWRQDTSTRPHSQEEARGVRTREFTVTRVSSTPTTTQNKLHYSAKKVTSKQPSTSHGIDSLKSEFLQLHVLNESIAARIGSK